MFLGKDDCKFIGRRCLSFYSSQNVLMKHKQRCEQQEATAIKFLQESHFCQQKYFHNIPLKFGTYADFETDNEIDISIIGNEATNISKENRLFNGYFRISDLNDVLQSGCYESPLGYHISDVLDELTKLEKKLTFYFKNTKKYIIMTEKDQEHQRKKN